MADKVLQGVVAEVGSGLGITVGVTDERGAVVLCSDELRIGELRSDVYEAGRAGDEYYTGGGCTYKFFDAEMRDGQAVFVESTAETAKSYAAMLLIAITNVKKYYDDKFNKSNFVKNVVMDNILPGDIYSKAKELHLSLDVSRVVLLVRVVSGRDISALEIISSLFPDKGKDFVFSVSETETVIVKELAPWVEKKDIQNLATAILDMLESEHFIKAIAGIGTRFVGVKDMATSFKEAQMALEVGKVFYTEQDIISYDSLGIARLIYHLPTTLCEAFLNEVFKKGSIDSLDSETLFTIKYFFENNLNVSETSRGLFVHRNTLVYRLDKIRKLTGLDLRQFEHAIIFKVALMVKKYLDSTPTKY